MWKYIGFPKKLSKNGAFSIAILVYWRVDVLRELFESLRDLSGTETNCVHGITV